MAEFLFLVETNEKAEMITLIAGDLIEVVVLEQCPATFSIETLGQAGGAVFSFKPVSAVWSPVFERIRCYEHVYYGFDTCVDGDHASYLVDQLLAITAPNIQGHRLNIAGFTAGILAESVSLVEPLVEDACVSFLQHNLFHKVFYSHLARLLGTTMGPGGIELSIPTLSLLAMLADKHRALVQVVRSQKWEVALSIQQDGVGFPGRLAEVYGVSSDGFLDSAEQAKSLAETINGEGFVFVDRSDKQIFFPSPSLYTLAELVFDAYRFFKIGPGDVLQGLNELFTGVDLGQGKVGLITSPFGVSTVNMRPVFNGLCQFVLDSYADLAKVQKEFSDGVILPIDLTVQPTDVKVSKVIDNLYTLIWSKSVASQLIDGIGRDQKVMFEKDGKRVQFSHLFLVQKGFLSVFGYGYEDVFSETSFHEYGEGDVVIVAGVLPQHVMVQGLAQYTISSLCEEMRELGFDDENQIILLLQELLTHHYTMLNSTGEVMCTETLLKVVSTMDRAFPGMKGLNLSAYYGQTFAEVLTGRKRLDVALKQFDQSLVMQGAPLVKIRMPTSIPKVKRKAKNVIKGGAHVVSAVDHLTEGFADFAEVVEQPSDCDEVVEDDVVEQSVALEPVIIEEAVVEPVEDVVEPKGLTGDSAVIVEREEVEKVPVVMANVDVSGEVDDVFLKPLPPDDECVEVVAPPPPLDSVDLAKVETKPCSECGRPMVVKDDRFGKFWSCTGVPACHHSETYQKNKQPESPQGCPVCKRGSLTVNRTSAGKSMYSCTDPSCGFMAWSKPYVIDCPLCGSSFLIQKKDRMGHVSLRCPMAGCSYIHGGESEGDKGPDKPKKRKVRVRRKKSGSTGGKKRRVVRRRKSS